MHRQDRWNESYAREVLAHAERQGLSDAAVAEKLGGSAQRVAWWRKRLAAPEDDLGVNEFVEVCVVPTRRLPMQERPFVVHTASGRSVEVWSGFDREELERLLRVVEMEGSC
jgi:hypothetical protein